MKKTEKDKNGSFDTQLKEAKRSQLRYKMAQEVGHIGNWEYDVQSDKFWGSEEAKRIYGFDPEAIDFTSEEVHRCIKESDRQRVQQVLVDLIENGKEYNIEFQITPRNATQPRTLWSVAEVKRDESGAPVVVVGVLQDITERKKTEISLRHSEEKYRTLFNTMTQGVVYQDADGAIISANPAAQRILGLTLDQMQGRTSMDPRWKAIYEDGRDMPGDMHPNPVALRTGKEIRNMVQGIYHPAKNTYVWISVNAVPLFRPGESRPYQVYAVFEDITTRKESEEVLRENEKHLTVTGQMAKIGGWELYPETMRVTWTDETYRIHEMPKSIKPPLEDAINFWHPEDQPILRKAIQQAIDNGVPYDLELRFITAKGRSLYARTKCNPVVHDGKVVKLQGFFQDITDRKQAEKALRHNRERLEFALQSGGLGIWDWNPRTGTVVFSDLWARMLEYRPDEIEPTVDFFKRHIHPEDLAAVVDRLTGHVEGRVPTYESEHRMRTKSGKWLWVMDRGKAVDRDKDGSPVRVTGIIADITGRKRAENALRESEGKLSALFSSMAEMVVLHEMVCDGQGKPVNYRIIDCNDAFTGITGIPRESAVGRLATDVYETDEPPYLREFSQVALGGEPCYFETYFPPTEKHLAISVVRPQENHFATVTTDITDHKLAEDAIAAEKERLAVTLRSIGDGVITTDMNGDVVLMNNVAEELTGWKQDEARGKSLDSVFAIIHEITRIPCENPVQRVLSTGNVIELANHTVLISRDGTERIIADSGAPIKDKDSNTIGVVLVFRDTTEKQRLIEITQNSQKLESLGILAGGIAHDFNNLLGGIYGYIDMAAGIPAKSEMVSQYLSKAMNTIDRARDLTRQLLTFAKGGAPVQKVEKVFPFVQETALFALSGSNVTCRFDVPNDLWACNFDKNQIGQVIDNLIINAVQAMPMGGTIAVNARNRTLAEREHPVPVKGNFVMISIQDSGIGIPRDMLSRIFDPFFTTKSKGHGLGLATCYSIINRHGGCIDVDSDLGKGSVFHVYLPAVEAACASSVKQTSGKHKGSGTILVMDDEEVMREILKDMLETFGYNVVCKDNGKDALDYIAAQLEANRAVSGMIFDLTVPGGMGGMEAVEKVRKIDTETPVFVASGYADGAAMKNPVDYGFTASICKPFRRAELMEMLEKHMKMKN